MDNLDTAHDAGPGELAGLREQFPGFRIWREITGERVRYVVMDSHTATGMRRVIEGELTNIVRRRLGDGATLELISAKP